MFYFMWKVRSLTEPINSGEEISDLDIDHLRGWQDIFATNLIATFSSRASLDTVRLVGAGTYLDLHVLFATLRPTKQTKGKKSQTGQASDGNVHLQSLVNEIESNVQAELTSIFEALEKQFAKKSKRRLAEPSDDEAPEDLESDEDEDDDAVTASERQAEALRAEQQLCELSGKLVLAILAQVIDASGESKGKLRSRLQRNHKQLGPNFKEVVAYLDEPKPKAKKGGASKSQPAKKAPARSAEMVDEEEEEEDPFADIEHEEGTVEDLRRRELLDEEPEGRGDETGGEEEGGGGHEDEEEDEVMGD